VFHFRPATNSNVVQKPRPKRHGDKQIEKKGWNKSKTKLTTEFSKAWNNCTSSTGHKILVYFGSCHFKSIKIHKAF
jgi:hypothetical protein